MSDGATTTGNLGAGIQQVYAGADRRRFKCLDCNDGHEIAGVAGLQEHQDTVHHGSFRNEMTADPESAERDARHSADWAKVFNDRRLKK